MHHGRHRRNETDGCKSTQERKQQQVPLLSGSERRSDAVKSSATLPINPLSPADSLEPPRATPETMSAEDCSSLLQYPNSGVNASANSISSRGSNSHAGGKLLVEKKTTHTENGGSELSRSGTPTTGGKRTGNGTGKEAWTPTYDLDDDVEGGGDDDDDDDEEEELNRVPVWNDLIRVNVSGQKFDFRRSVLERHPETLLGNPEKRSVYYDARRQEYFFDRHRPSFEAIFSYYQYGGRLRRPHQVADDVFLAEVLFHEIEPDVVLTYKKSEGYSEEELILPDHRKLQVNQS